MAKLAILGFGIVGGGVYEVLRRNAAGVTRRLGEELKVGYICDIRDFSDHPDAALFVKDIEPILADEEVRVVVETIGGTKPAYDYVCKALDAGRHVVTSNKEMVAQYGAELLARAKKNNVCFLFEASVGGGTPIITPIHQCLAANRIFSIAGIINGTTNFMLGRMEKAGMDFPAALKEAQDLGYAETKDPSDDVDGIDACRKISILSSLAFGSHIYPQNVRARGIRDITPADMEAARKLNCSVKLISWCEKPEGGSLSVAVEPMMVRRSDQLAGVDDVFNAVKVEGDMLGEVLFYGKGAGKLPTASAVVADAIDAMKEGVKIHSSLFWQPAKPIEGYYPAGDAGEWYLRAEKTSDMEALPGAVQVADGAFTVPNLTPDEVIAFRQKHAGEACEAMKIWPKDETVL